MLELRYKVRKSQITGKMTAGDLDISWRQVQMTAVEILHAFSACVQISLVYLKESE